MDSKEVRYRFGHAFNVLRERATVIHGASGQDAQGWPSHWDIERTSESDLKVALRRAAPGAEQHLATYLAEATRPPFYRSCDDLYNIASAYKNLFPASIPRIIASAERLCSHEITVFASAPLSFRGGSQWRTDLVNGVESDLRHWSRVRYLEFSRVGDSKIAWEPNRHQHLVTLALAYRLTGEERFAEECVRQWEDWHTANPHLRGINWASSLEVAFRAWSWIWMSRLLQGSRSMAGEQLAKLIESLALHADYVETNLSTYFSPNTHLLGEGFILFVIGLLYPELKNSQRNHNIGKNILLSAMTDQVRSDGAHAEQSTCYHHYAVDFFLCAAILADRNGNPLPDWYLNKLQLMLEFLKHTAWPDGTHPIIGDDDGGRLLPFGKAEPQDYRSTLQSGAIYFGRKDLLPYSLRASEGAFWLLGESAIIEFSQVSSRKPREYSRVFPDSGLAVMRSHWGTDANVLLFDAGPQGMMNCAHGHADALSVLCAAQGIQWLVDPGSYVYTSSPEWRDSFRQREAHNTVTIDKESQARPLEAFHWKETCDAHLLVWKTFPNLDYAKGAHGGFQRLSKPVTHIRRVIFVKPDYWFLLDEFEGDGAHAIESFFHFAPETQLFLETGRCIAERQGRRFGLITRSDVAMKTACGEETTREGWHSCNYGSREAAPVLKAALTETVPASIPWVLWPDMSHELILSKVCSSADGWTVKTAEGIDLFAFSQRTPRSETISLTNGDFGFVRFDPEGRIKQMTMIKGSFLNDVSGSRQVRAAQTVDELDMKCESGSLHIHSRPQTSITCFDDGGIREVFLNGKRVDFRSNPDGTLSIEG